MFKREAIAVRGLFDKRFATKAHSLSLINHDSTVEKVPIASSDNLGKALAHIGG